MIDTVALTDNLPELPQGTMVRMYSHLKPEEAVAAFRDKYHYNPYRVYTLRHLVFVQPWPDKP